MVCNRAMSLAINDTGYHGSRLRIRLHRSVGVGVVESTVQLVQIAHSALG